MFGRHFSALFDQLVSVFDMYSTSLLSLCERQKPEGLLLTFLQKQVPTGKTSGLEWTSSTLCTLHSFPLALPCPS